MSLLRALDTACTEAGVSRHTLDGWLRARKLPPAHAWDRHPLRFLILIVQSWHRSAPPPKEQQTRWS